MLHFIITMVAVFGFIGIWSSIMIVVADKTKDESDV